jgi:hypothetical protein
MGEYVDLDESLRRLDLVTADGIRELAEELVSRPLSVAAVGTIDESALMGLAADTGVGSGLAESPAPAH